jgi:hypothetical protein
MEERGNPRFQITVLKLNGPIAQSRLERTPDKREVVGSIPTRPTRIDQRPITISQ